MCAGPWSPTLCSGKSQQNACHSSTSSTTICGQCTNVQRLCTSTNWDRAKGSPTAQFALKAQRVAGNMASMLHCLRSPVRTNLVSFTFASLANSGLMSLEGFRCHWAGRFDCPTLGQVLWQLPCPRDLSHSRLNPPPSPLHLHVLFLCHTGSIGMRCLLGFAL